MKTMSLPLMTTLRYLFASMVVMSLLGVQGCKKDSNDGPDDTLSVTQSITSTDPGGVLTLEGNSLIVPPGTVPRLANGDPATVNFSVEVNVELPQALPSNMKLVGETVHFGPEGFIMSEAMYVIFQLPEGVAVDQVSVIGYDNVNDKYGVYPITYYDPDRQEVGAAVYELGYYMLANVAELNRIRNSTASGGIRINSMNSYGWYPSSAGNSVNASQAYSKLIITNFVPKYPEQMAYWAPYDPNSNGGQRWWEASTPPNVTGWGPNHTLGITWYGPQGTYTAQLVVSYKEGLFDLPKCKQYSLPLTFTIDEPVSCTSMSTCSGWSPGPSVPSGGTWSDIPCATYKPLATVPVCTGEFQATLTWYNGNGSSGESDVDLHLYGPDGLHVYYSNKNPGVGGITLDRDMISETGWVQENICAPTLSGMPRGDYELQVHLFDGEDKDFQVRLLRGGNANSYSGRVTNDNPTKSIIKFRL
ncbi:MAG: hypothetical protein J5I41_06115 [Saprospiraceae bacterium]|nr:hypothetical protein [Saprospiraceae bacterium]